MDINYIREPLTDFFQKVSKKIQVDQIIVFGSYSTETATEDSDIDVLIISDDFQNLEEDQRLQVLYKAARFIEPSVEPWGFTNEELNKAGPLTTLGNARERGLRLDKRYKALEEVKAIRL
jgi:uncharacterized protein